MKEAREVMQHNQIIPERLEDCLSVTMDGLKIHREDILDVIPQAGGLFNFLLRVETSGGVYFFKQYLNDVSNGVFNPPKIPASTRAQLACEVQELASAATRSLRGEVIPTIIRFDRARNAFLMTKAAGDRPYIDFLSTGQRPSVLFDQLPKVLGHLHQSTFGKYSRESIFGNTAFRDFKLKIQYDDIAARLSEEQAKVVLRCKADYQARMDCVTHGDINSRNIMVGPDTIGVIDFEQSHLGTPAYDLAYILCEVFISLEASGDSNEFGTVVTKFLDRYFECFHAADRDSVESEITPHLAIQTLYRFWGPSRNSWTFYVDEASKDRIIRRAQVLLMEEGPIRNLFGRDVSFA
jgi:Ser/Thr protein kinase RdoA (MazF antagonist)